MNDREARNAEIVGLARSEPSLTLVEIGARVGFSDSAVGRVLDRLAAQGSAPVDLRDRRIERAEALYRSGLSLKEVGAQLDVSFATVANLLRAARVPTLPRGSGGWPREKRAEWMASRTAVPVGPRR